MCEINKDECQKNMFLARTLTFVTCCTCVFSNQDLFLEKQKRVVHLGCKVYATMLNIHLFLQTFSVSMMSVVPLYPWDSFPRSQNAMSIVEFHLKRSFLLPLYRAGYDQHAKRVGFLSFGSYWGLEISGPAGVFPIQELGNPLVRTSCGWSRTFVRVESFRRHLNTT